MGKRSDGRALLVSESVLPCRVLAGCVNFGLSLLKFTIKEFCDYLFIVNIVCGYSKRQYQIKGRIKRFEALPTPLAGR